MNLHQNEVKSRNYFDGHNLQDTRFFVKSARFVMIWVVYLVPYIVICFWIASLKWTELSFLGNQQICFKSVKILFKIEKVL